MTLRTKRFLAMGAFTAALHAGAFAVLGYVMSGSLTGNRIAAYVYLGLVGISIVVIAAAIVALRRLRG
jgi:membrane protein DedA with SNARE-associated domain